MTKKQIKFRCTPLASILMFSWSFYRQPESSLVIWQSHGRLDWSHLSFISCCIDFAMVCHSMSFPFYESWFIKLQAAIIGNHYTLRLSRELSPFEWIPGRMEDFREMEKSWRRERERERGKRERVWGDRCASSRYIKLLCHRQVNPHLTLRQTQWWSSCRACKLWALTRCYSLKHHSALIHTHQRWLST